MQIYLLAANLFTLAALLLGLGSFSRSARGWRLLPLFLLVISRSLSLVITLATLERDQPPVIIGALEVFSIFCVIWTLTSPLAHLPRPWPQLVWPGVAGALLLSLLPLLPAWPVPTQIHSLIIAVFGASLILISAGEARWSHLATPLILALADFLSLLNLTGVSWLISLLGYVFLISAIHWESLQVYHQAYRERQRSAEALIEEALNLSRERQRWLEVSEIISTMPNLSQSMEHIVRSMAQITHTDQSALVMLDTHHRGQAHLVTLYSPERPVHIPAHHEITFRLDQCPPLRTALDSQQPLLLPQQRSNGLNKLYALWNESRLGPTLIQPLTVHNRPVGALVLGNPVTNRRIRESDIRLCQNLAPQIATLVEYRRRYLELESQAEAIQKQASQPDEHRAILETINDGLVVSDTTGQVQLVNKAAERILGKPYWELIGQSIGTIYGVIDSGETVEDLAMAFSRRNQPLSTFIEFEDRAIQGRLVPWRNQESEWLGIIAVFRDVTREIKADRARNDFIAALSRELRAPLTLIKGYADIITRGAMGDYSPEQLRVQRIIRSSADRMATILDNAIHITAQNRHKFLPRFEETDVSKVIDEALQGITPLTQVRELKLSREIETPLPSIMADPKQIRQILDNLLANACRFTPPGGQITLRAWLQSEGVGNTARAHLILAVADNGIGIPPSEHRRIFDPFYQIKNQNLTEESGMGMGLAVVKELVELHNGRVWVESIVGGGSVFQVALPLTQEY